MRTILATVNLFVFMKCVSSNASYWSDAELHAVNFFQCGLLSYSFEDKEIHPVV